MYTPAWTVYGRTHYLRDRRDSEIRDGASRKSPPLDPARPANSADGTSGPRRKEDLAKTTPSGLTSMEGSPPPLNPARPANSADDASGPQRGEDPANTTLSGPASMEGMPGLDPTQPNALPESSAPTTPTRAPESTLKRPAMKLPKYDGEGQLETYLVQVQLAAVFNGWSSEETGVQVALALSGKALQALTDLTPGQHVNWPAIKGALQRRFGQRIFVDDVREKLATRCRTEGERLGTFTADLRLYARRGYPGFALAEQEELTLQAFMRGLRPERLREHIRLTFPRS